MVLAFSCFIATVLVLYYHKNLPINGNPKKKLIASVFPQISIFLYQCVLTFTLVFSPYLSSINLITFQIKLYFPFMLSKFLGLRQCISNLLIITQKVLSLAKKPICLELSGTHFWNPNPSSLKKGEDWGSDCCSETGTGGV